MKLLFALFLLLPAILWSCNKSDDHDIQAENPIESLLPAHLKDNFQMVWNDEFDGTTIDQGKWNFRGEGTVRNYGTVS